MTLIRISGIQGEGRKRVIIEGISPAVDGGRFPVKRTVGDQVRVEADIFTDGHDAIAASLLAHREGDFIVVESKGPEGWIWRWQGLDARR